MSPIAAPVAPTSAQAPLLWSEPDLRVQLAAQRAAFRQKARSYAERIDALRALESAVLRRQNAILAAAHQDLAGRPAEDTVALDVLPLLREIRQARRTLKKTGIVSRPLGVVGVVSSWSYPFFLTLAPLAGILAAGNHALAKPSALAPASADLIGSIVAECFPPGYVSVVTGGPGVTHDFCALPFDHLYWSGTPAKTPAVVHQDYPIDVAAERIVRAKLANAGQTTAAPDYVFVPRGRAQEFIEAAAVAASRAFSLAGDGTARIVDAAHYRRLARLLDDALRRGASVTVLNPDLDRPASFLFPTTIVTRVSDEMMLMRDETFGPILALAEYQDVEDAIDYVNGRPRSLALYYFDTDTARIEHVTGRASSAHVAINDCALRLGQPNFPFEASPHQRRWVPGDLTGNPYRLWTGGPLDQVVH